MMPQLRRSMEYLLAKELWSAQRQNRAGTWQAEATAPGTVQFDSVKVVR